MLMRLNNISLLRCDNSDSIGPSGFEELNYDLTAETNRNSIIILSDSFSSFSEV